MSKPSFDGFVTFPTCFVLAVAFFSHVICIDATIVSTQMADLKVSARMSAMVNQMSDFVRFTVFCSMIDAFPNHLLGLFILNFFPRPQLNFNFFGFFHSETQKSPVDGAFGLKAFHSQPFQMAHAINTKITK